MVTSRLWRPARWVALVALLCGVVGALNAPFGTAPAGAQDPIVTISEVRTDQPGDDDPDEYVELAGAPDTALDGLTYLVIGDGDAAAGSGVIEAEIDLGGQMIPASGYFVIAEDTFALGAADLVTALNFENSDNVTHLLVQGFSGADGQDLDTDDDGALDVTPWESVSDRLALLEEANPPAETEYHYGPPTVGPDGIYAPGHAYRCGGAWGIGPFDPASAGAMDSPGVPNPCGGGLAQAAEITPTASSAEAALDVCGDAATLISAVQGTEADSPAARQTVTIEGVVIGDFQGTEAKRGFYVQEEDADADSDPATSEGIFVYDAGSGLDVAVGDRVRVTGRVQEYYGLTELSELTALDVCDSGNPLPEQVTVAMPVSDVSDWEAYEGMRVTIPQTLTVGDTYNLGRFGEIALFAGGPAYQYTQIEPPDEAGLDAYMAELARRTITLDDGSGAENPETVIFPPPELTATNTLRSGATVTGLSGILNYGYDLWRIDPTGPVTFTDANPRPATPPEVGGSVTVASFNVLNYFNGDGTGGGFPTARGANTPVEFERQRTKIVGAIGELNAAVVGLMEIENDGDGPESSIADLVAGLNAAFGEGTYDYIRTGVIGTDEIRVALIYQPGTVTPVGGPAILTAAGHPLFDDNLNRPAVAQTFEVNASGERFTVAVNHLKSKGSACGAGDDDVTTGQGNCNVTRTNAAVALAEWLASDPTGGGTDRTLIIGDLNAYAQEDPIAALEAAGYVNLLARSAGETAYTYVFDGLLGNLDHALASPALADEVTGAAAWHINADEPRVLDYNDTELTADESAGDTRQSEAFYAPTVYRASDHDPVVIGLALSGEGQPQASATPAEGEVPPQETEAPATTPEMETPEETPAQETSVAGIFDPALSVRGEFDAGAQGVPGDALTWHLTVENQGTGAGRDVLVADTLVDALRIDSIETGDGSYRIDGQTVVFVIPQLDPGETVALKIETSLAGEPGAEIGNSVILSGLGPDGGTVEIDATAIVPVPAGAGATATPTGAADEPASGDDDADDDADDDSPVGWLSALLIAVVVLVVAMGVLIRGRRPPEEDPVDAYEPVPPADAPVVEPAAEPVVEEPVVVVPVVEPVVEEPPADEPIAEEPIEAPVVEEPVEAVPLAEAPPVEEPVVEEPTDEDTAELVDESEDEDEGEDEPDDFEDDDSDDEDPDRRTT